MKLYNIYESIILEEQLITENKLEELKKAIDGKYYVNLKYNNKGKVTDRYVQIYQIGNSKNGLAISAWQAGGGTNPTKNNNQPSGWKVFMVDKIVDGSIEPTNMKFNKPVSSLPSFNKKDGVYNPNNTRMGVTHRVDFTK